MPATVDSIVDQISGMTAMELSELKKALEDKFGVTAAAPMGGMMMMAPGAGAAAPAEEEKTEFDAILTSAGDAKLNVIKAVAKSRVLALKKPRISSMARQSRSSRPSARTRPTRSRR